MIEVSRVRQIPGSRRMKRTPQSLVASVGLGVPTRLGDRRSDGGGRFEPELPEAALLTVLKLTHVRTFEPLNTPRRSNLFLDLPRQSGSRCVRRSLRRSRNR